MHTPSKIQTMTATALLIAIGIIIPFFSPLRIVLEPASFTLASHVCIFLAMFISPLTAAAVSVGTTLGFFLGGFPLVVVLRAGSQIIFALVGAFLLKQRPNILQGAAKTQLYSFGIALLHAAAEMLVVTFFYFGGGMGTAYYAQGFVVSVLLLVGVGTVVHSMVDFLISLLILKALSRQKQLAALFRYSPYIPARQNAAPSGES